MFHVLSDCRFGCLFDLFCLRICVVICLCVGLTGHWSDSLVVVFLVGLLCWCCIRLLMFSVVGLLDH